MRLFTKSLLFLLILLGVISSVCMAQTNPRRLKHAGKDFWLSTQSMLHYAPFLTFEIYITGEEDANINLSYTSINQNKRYFLKGRTVLRIELSQLEVNAIAGTKFQIADRKSLHITSDKDIVVHYTSWGIATDDGSIVYPTDKQQYGDLFYLNGAKSMMWSGNNKNFGGFTIVATCDNVELEITPSERTDKQDAGIPYQVHLNKGDTYCMTLHPNVSGSDLSGTIVKVKNSSCCNPINIFMTYFITFASNVIEYNKTGVVAGAGDQLFEQMLPVSLWDTLYPVLPFRNNVYNNIKLVSASNNNTIFFDGVPVKTMAQGGIFDTIVGNPVIISSSARFSVTEYMMSQHFINPMDPPSDDSLTDPDALWITVPDNGLRETYFQTVGEINKKGEFYNKLHVLTLVSMADNISTVSLNNVSLASEFLPFPGNPDYMYTYVKLDTGMEYHLVAKDKITAFYSGIAHYGSVTYNLGDIRDELIIDSFVICSRDILTLTADPADVYVWSTGDTTRYIKVSANGLYALNRYVFNGICTDEFRKYFYVDVKPYKEVHLSDTVYMCKNGEATLIATPGADHLLWFSGSTEEQVVVTAYGDAYTVNEAYQSDCMLQLHDFTVLPPESSVSINIGPDTVACTGDSLVLVGGGPHTNWSTGVTGDSIKVRVPGIYWASVKDTCLDIRYFDTIVLNDMFCAERYCTLVFPTAFSPNNDGVNDLFRPISYGAITGYHMNIYNRWGEMLYESHLEGRGWDGTQKGVEAAAGVYYYLSSYDCPLKGNIRLKGEVTLIR